jgi:hypothetical protein
VFKFLQGKSKHQGNLAAIEKFLRPTGSEN